MNPRQKMIFACAFLWMILGLVVSSSGKPSAVDGDGPVSPSQSSQDTKVAGVPSPVVPQIGVLEERGNVRGLGADDLPLIIGGPGASPGQTDTAGRGILVPIVSVSGGDSSKSGTAGNLNSPLVALLPAPSESESKLPGIPTVSVLQLDDQPPKPEIRRSLATGNGDRSEMMDVAEDIVFRPLFRIRQPAGRSRERNYRPNYRRYNLNGYYRLPYN